MIARIDAPGVPYGPVSLERALRIRRIGCEPVSDVTFDLIERAQSPLGIGPKRLLRDQRTGRHRIAPSGESNAL
jgi:hypothetical protein